MHYISVFIMQCIYNTSLQNACGHSSVDTEWANLHTFFLIHAILPAFLTRMVWEQNYRFIPSSKYLSCFDKVYTLLSIHKTMFCPAGCCWMLPVLLPSETWEHQCPSSLTPYSSQQVPRSEAKWSNGSVKMHHSEGNITHTWTIAIWCWYPGMLTT